MPSIQTSHQSLRARKHQSSQHEFFSVNQKKKKSHLRFSTNVVLNQATRERGGSNEGGEERAGDVHHSVGKELLLTDEANIALLDISKT